MGVDHCHVRGNVPLYLLLFDTTALYACANANNSDATSFSCLLYVEPVVTCWGYVRVCRACVCVYSCVCCPCVCVCVAVCVCVCMQAHTKGGISATAVALTVVSQNSRILLSKNHDWRLNVWKVNGQGSRFCVLWTWMMMVSNKTWGQCVNR